MYQSANTNLWNGRLDSDTDPNEFRHWQTVKFVDLEKKSLEQDKRGVGILGYAVDEGVILNQGREGAKFAPNYIKHCFSNLPDLNQCEQIIDYGNIIHQDNKSLDSTVSEMGKFSARVMKNHQQTFLIGGGHDIAYAQYLATRENFPNASIGIINIDAHFDTRNSKDLNSGNSFRRILEEDDQVDYFGLGLAQGGNTRALYNFAEEKNIKYVYADELLHDVSPPIKDMIELFIHNHDTIMFTICMDVIDSAFAPGVSAPSVLGLYPHTVFDIGKRVILSQKVSSVSIAEANPNYDIDQRTSRLAANLMHHFLV